MMNEFKKSLIELEVMVNNLTESVLRIYGKESARDNSYGIKTYNIIKFENIFNEFYMVKGNYYITMSGIDENEMVTLSMFEKDTNKLLFDLQVYYDEDAYKLITAFISQIYEDYLIQLEKYINGWNAFSKRKAKSLTLWLERNNKDKVTEINREIIDRYTQMEETKK